MINSHPNFISIKQQGITTLLTAVILLVTMTLLVMFAANNSIIQQKIAANQSTNQQAFSAAQAGLDVGIPYLEQNSATILANPANGFIAPYTDTNIQNITLGNNSQYTITYTNPIATNYALLKISVTGRDAGNIANKTISEQAQFSSLLSTTPTNPLTIKGELTLSGTAVITNLESNSTIISGEGVSISGSAATVLQSGVGSNKNLIGSDIQQNNSSINNMSQNDLFVSYFGATTSMVQNEISNYYTNNTNTNYSSTLNGKTGTSIWINQTSGTATISGTTTIGSASAPVLLIISGNAKISGNVTIYGMVYFVNSSEVNLDLTGNLTIVGGIVTASDLKIGGTTNIIYSSSTLNNLKNTVLKNYNKVPGSWKDF